MPTITQPINQVIDQVSDEQAREYNPVNNQRLSPNSPSTLLPSPSTHNHVQPVLNGYALPFGFYSMQWEYSLNTREYDTLGGRVVQILSIKTGTLNWESVAGSRLELRRIAAVVQGAMRTQASTQNPVNLIVPQRNWAFRVYVQSMPSIAWATESVEYPYRLSFEVYQDSGILASLAIKNEIDRLRAGVGQSNEFTGGNLADVQYALAVQSGEVTPDTPPTNFPLQDSGYSISNETGLGLSE